MTQAQVLLLPDEQLRLRECAQEPIQIPGAIQPHGALLALDRESLEILQVSENTADVLGIAASSLLGSGAAGLVDPEAVAFLHAFFAAEVASTTKYFTAQVNGRLVDLIAHVVDDVGVVEFEPAILISRDSAYLSDVHEAIQRLARASDVDELRHIAAREVRELTGFDQVMVYHFHPDGHGQVVADDHIAGAPSYLGLHFPASDIPEQARRLYQLKGSGLIASSSYRPAALIPTNNPRTRAPLDLSRAELRSVSPHHLQFMRNMGQGASCTLSLRVDGQLLGLVTCAHRSPRRIPFVVRRMCEVLVQQLVLQLHAMTRADTLTRQLQRHEVRDVLVEQMKLDQDIAVGLTNEAVTILDLVPADGAEVYLDNRRSTVGDTPGSARTGALLRALTQEDGSMSPLLSDSLARDRPDLAELVPTFAGVLVLPFGRAGDCLIWFRHEITQTVEWLGAQSVNNRSTPLSPRTSFESWCQTVADRSNPWNEVDITEASELGRSIDQSLLHRIEAQLVHLASHDSLTGLPNRYLLMERITTSLERADRRSDEVAILFCDLDDFKRVNDTAGHAAGDAVLVETARRLRSVLRSGDSVARVGGDEFVVVLEPTADRGPTPEVLGGEPSDLLDTTAETLTEPGDARQAATRMSERIKSELNRPISYQGQEHIIAVSVGISFAEPGRGAEELVRDADTAMYRAKQTGKNCVAIFEDSMRASILEMAAAEQALRAVLAPAGEPKPQSQSQSHSHSYPHPRLSLVYRPFVHVDSGGLIGFEARPQLTDSDGQFIPLEMCKTVSEKTGMINEFSRTVREAGLAALADWQTSHPADPPARVALELSGARLAQQADFASLVLSALHQHGLQPASLILELTESALIGAGPSALRELTTLRDSGVGVTLNNFGSGFANLQHLAVLPVSAIKIDPSFTAVLPSDETGALIVDAIAGLAADMHLVCVVTGIDTQQQLDALPAGVIALGSLIGEPSPAPSYERRTEPIRSAAGAAGTPFSE
jgi:two-component system, chemotaxis family, sensor kinase Cph1